MRKSLIFDGSGLRVELRRFFFGMATLALFGTAGQLVWNRATAAAYSPKSISFRTPNPFFEMSPTAPQPQFAGIHSGKVYANKTPGFVQTLQGQGVYDDRRVLDLAKTGPGAMDFQVKFLDPASDTPTEMPLAMFMSQVGEDVTESLPPVNEGPGQTGTGHNWRLWAGAGAATTPAAPTVFTPGAGQVQDQTAAVAASMPEGIKLPEAPAEGSEKVNRITAAPAPAAPAPAPAAPAPAAPVVAAAPAAPANDANPDSDGNNFANSDSDRPAAPAAPAAPAPAAPLRDRAPSRLSGQPAVKAAPRSPSQATEKAAGVDAGTTTAQAKANE